MVQPPLQVLHVLIGPWSRERPQSSGKFGPFSRNHFELISSPIPSHTHTLKKMMSEEQKFSLTNSSAVNNLEVPEDTLGL